MWNFVSVRHTKVNPTTLAVSRQTKVPEFSLFLDIAVFFLAEAVNSRALRVSDLN